MTREPAWIGDAQTAAVVLIHGLGGSHRTWEQVVPRLAERRRVLAPDLIGGVSIEEEAENLLGLLEARSAGKATVVGHSMGGLVGTALAERSAARVERLVLVNTPPSFASRLTAHSGSERLIRRPVIGPLVWSRLTDARRRAGLRSAVAGGAPVPEAFVTDLRETSRREFVGSTKAIDRYLDDRPLAERLAAIEVAVDVVFGEQDQRVDPASLAVYDAVPRARVTRIPASGHSPPWEAPELLTAVILGPDPRSASSG